MRVYPLANRFGWAAGWSEIQGTTGWKAKAPAPISAAPKRWVRGAGQQLILAQGGDGIGAHGAQSGEGAGGERHAQQCRGGGGQRDGVAGADAE